MTRSSTVARLLFWAAALFTLAMALIPQPPHVPGGFSDKVQHAAAFATLGVLGSFAYGRMPALRLVAALSAYGALIEVLQAIPAIHRDSDILDWVADTVACVAVVAVLRWWRRSRR